MSRVDLKTNETELLNARNAILNDETMRKYVIFGRFILSSGLRHDIESDTVQVTGTLVRVTPSWWRRRARTRPAAASSPSSRSSTAAGERRGINIGELRALMRCLKVPVRTDRSCQRGKRNKGEDSLHFVRYTPHLPAYDFSKNIFCQHVLIIWQGEGTPILRKSACAHHAQEVTE